MYAPPANFYLERPDGTLTALIEVDQLPPSVGIIGIMKSLPLSQTGKMQWLGIRPRGKEYSVAVLEDSTGASSTNPVSLSPQSTAVGENFNLSAEVEVWPQDVASNKSPMNQGSSPNSLPASSVIFSENDASVHEDIAPLALTPESDSIAAPDLVPAASPHPQNTAKPKEEMKKKVYCTYWLRHGACDYIQQGCKYKHEMPDEVTLKALGFQHGTPSWYRKVMAAKKGSTEGRPPAQILRGRHFSMPPESLANQTPAPIRPRPNMGSQTSAEADPYTLSTAMPKLHSHQLLGSSNFRKGQKSSYNSSCGYIPGRGRARGRGIGRGRIIVERHERRESCSRETSAFRQINKPLEFYSHSQPAEPFTRPDDNPAPRRSVGSFSTTALVQGALRSSTPGYVEIDIPHRLHFTDTGELSYITNGAHTSNGKGKEKESRDENIDGKGDGKEIKQNDFIGSLIDLD